MTLSLADTQQAFQTAVLHLQKATPDFIIGTPQVSADQRFKVYTDAYRLRLIEALSADFQALHTYLGDDGFAGLGQTYIDASPSDQFSVRWFGRHLPRFLAETPPYTEQPELNELAVFEWALSEAFDAAESTLLSHAQLVTIDPNAWPSLTLHFHPSLRRINLHSNAPQIWQAANQKQALPEFTRQPEAQAWSIWRHEQKLLFRSLSEQEAYALDAFVQGQCFAEICTGLSEWLEEADVVMKLASFLQTWLRDGWIADKATGVAKAT
ncbi:hypothetical protein VZ94_12145 [Methylocucumis oryzae]|uniref:Putative DNA-binding domain-containing protein n=2 Tax=Methylocucumis oryzae TaxID=1632867 RepID=A0A0F3IID4_9GAMM|nr:hypothetical protein VZ94_12145 [Methylocucumis oryzae]